MKNTKRIVTGLLFTASLALSLLASGGDAYAKSKSGPSRAFTSDHDITITIPSTPLNGLLRALGVTWE
jgi:hypothetical protein